jgi:hypothetical protein
MNQSDDRVALKSTKRRGSSGLALLLVLALGGCQTAGRTADLSTATSVSLVQPVSGRAPLATSGLSSSEREQVCMQMGFRLGKADSVIIGGLLVLAAPIIVLYLVLSPFTMVLSR